MALFIFLKINIYYINIYRKRKIVKKAHNMEHKPHNALTEQELIIRAKLLRLENEDQKEDSQRWMIWFLLGGMLLYPFLVIICSYFNLENAAKLLEDMSNIYFMSISGLVSVYFGSNAYAKSRTVHSMDIRPPSDDEPQD